MSTPTCDMPAMPLIFKSDLWTADANQKTLDYDPMAVATTFGLINGVQCALNVTNHLLIIAVTVMIGWQCLQIRFQKTGFHAFFCTLGFVFLIAEGALVRSASNVPTRGLAPITKNYAHFMLQSVGAFLGIIGTIQKSWGKKQHFKTTHGKLGMAACMVCFGNFVLGCVASYAYAYRDFDTPLVLRLFYDLISIAGVVLGMAAQIEGYETGYFKRNYVYRTTYKFCTVLILILTVFAPMMVLLRKLSLWREEKYM